MCSLIRFYLILIFFQSRSPIHGRGLYCTRNIAAGEMVIEYSGMLVRSVLTDKREKYYESKVWSLTTCGRIFRVMLTMVMNLSHSLWGLLSRGARSKKRVFLRWACVTGAQKNMGTRQGMRAREDDTLEVRGRFFFWHASPLLFATAFACASYWFFVRLLRRLLKAWVYNRAGKQQT